MRRAALAALLWWALAAVSPACAEVLRFRAELRPAAETPARASPAMGVAEVTLDTDSRIMSWRVRYAGLGTPVVAARFLWPREPGAGVAGDLEFAPPYRSPIVSSARLNDIQVGDLRAGLWSVELVTRKHPNGEWRGDLQRAR